MARAPKRQALPPPTPLQPPSLPAGVVFFDPEAGANFDVLANGTRRYHGVPAGFAFDAGGTLRPVPPPPAEPDTPPAGQE